MAPTTSYRTSALSRAPSHNTPDEWDNGRVATGGRRHAVAPRAAGGGRSRGAEDLPTPPLPMRPGEARARSWARGLLPAAAAAAAFGAAFAFGSATKSSPSPQAATSLAPPVTVQAPNASVPALAPDIPTPTLKPRPAPAHKPQSSPAPSTSSPPPSVLPTPPSTVNGTGGVVHGTGGVVHSTGGGGTTSSGGGGVVHGGP
jgi:hypothetical protein